MTLPNAPFCVILLGLSLAWVSPLAAQVSKPGQQGPVRGVPGTQLLVPPDWMPDLVVASAKATTTCAANGNVAAKIVATVKNQSPKGTADLSKVVWQIILGATWFSTGDNLGTPQTVKPLVGGPQTLKPGESWTGTLSIIGIPAFKKGKTTAGQYGFAVTADPSNAIAEADEKNNEALTYAFDPCFQP